MPVDLKLIANQPHPSLSFTLIASLTVGRLFVDTISVCTYVCLGNPSINKVRSKVSRRRQVRCMPDTSPKQLGGIIGTKTANIWCRKRVCKKTELRSNSLGLTHFVLHARPAKCSFLDSVVG